MFLQFLPFPSNYVSNQRTDLTGQRCFATLIAPLLAASSLWIGAGGHQRPRRQRAADMDSDHMCVLVTQLYPTLSDPVDCSSPGSSVHGILQVRILKWIATPFSRGSSLTQGLNSSLPHCRQILYHLSKVGDGKVPAGTAWAHSQSPDFSPVSPNPPQQSGARLSVAG